MCSIKSIKTTYEKNYSRYVVNLFLIFVLSLPILIQAGEYVNYQRPRVAFEDTAYDLGPGGYIDMSDADYDEGSMNIDIWSSYDTVDDRMNAIYFQGQLNSHTAVIQSMLSFKLSFLYGSSFMNVSPNCQNQGIKSVRIKPCGYNTSEHNPNEIVLKNAPLNEKITVSEDIHQCFTGGNKNNKTLKGDTNVGKRWAMMVEFTPGCGPLPGDGNGSGYDLGYCDGQHSTNSACTGAGNTWTRIHGGTQSIFLINKDNPAQFVGISTTLSSNTQNAASIGDAGRQAMLITGHTDPIMKDKNTFWAVTAPFAGNVIDHRWGFNCGTGGACPTDSVMLSFDDIIQEHSLNNAISLQGVDASYVSPTLMDQNGDGKYTDELWMLYAVGDAQDPSSGPHANWNYLGEGCTVYGQGETSSPYNSSATERLWSISGSPYSKTSVGNKAEYACDRSGGYCQHGLEFDYNELGYCHRKNKITGDICNVHQECNGINFCNENLCTTGYNCAGRGECQAPFAALGTSVSFGEACLSQNAVSGVCVRGYMNAGNHVFFPDQCKNAFSPVTITGLNSGHGQQNICNGVVSGSVAGDYSECLSGNFDWGTGKCKPGYISPGFGLGQVSHPDKCQTGQVALFSFVDGAGNQHSNINLCDGFANGTACDHTNYQHGCRGSCSSSSNTCVSLNGAAGTQCSFNEHCSSGICNGGGEDRGTCQ
jgi:hypothetical protein